MCSCASEGLSFPAYSDMPGTQEPSSLASASIKVGEFQVLRLPIKGTPR